MPSCSFRKCKNNSRNTNKAEGVTFHSFPQDSRFKEKWIRIIQQDQRDEEWLPKQFSRICSAHFKDNDFYTTPLGRRKIKLCAIPEPLEKITADKNIDPGSPLSHVTSVSDTDSVFDSPREIQLKIQLRKEKSKRVECRRENIKLKKQNKYLKSKNKSLRQLVKSLKQRK